MAAIRLDGLRPESVGLGRAALAILHALKTGAETVRLGVRNRPVAVSSANCNGFRFLESARVQCLRIRVHGCRQRAGWGRRGGPRRNRRRPARAVLRPDAAYLCGGDTCRHHPPLINGGRARSTACTPVLPTVEAAAGPTAWLLPRPAAFPSARPPAEIRMHGERPELFFGFSSFFLPVFNTGSKYAWSELTIGAEAVTVSDDPPGSASAASNFDPPPENRRPLPARPNCRPRRRVRPRAAGRTAWPRGNNSVCSRCTVYDCVLNSAGGFHGGAKFADSDPNAEWNIATGYTRVR